MYVSTGCWQTHTSIDAVGLHINHNENSCRAAASQPFFCLINGPDTWPWPFLYTNAKQIHKACANLALVLGSDAGAPWQFIKEIHRRWMMDFFSTFISGRGWIVKELTCIDLGIRDGECKQDPWGNQLMIEEISNLTSSRGDLWPMQW